MTDLEDAVEALRVAPDPDVRAALASMSSTEAPNRIRAALVRSPAQKATLIEINERKCENRLTPEQDEQDHAKVIALWEGLNLPGVNLKKALGDIVERTASRCAVPPVYWTQQF